jgi:cell division protein FtsB
MRINAGGGLDANLKKLVAFQVALLLAAAGFAAFLYGQMGPLLRQRAELQAGVDALRAETVALESQREALGAQTRSLAAERDQLNTEIARLNADRAVLSASMRTLSAGSDRAVSVVESAVAARADRRPLSPRVYVHVASEPSAERAGAVVRDLEQAGFIVPSVQRVRAVPSNPQLRFFSTEDKDVAQKAFDIIKTAVPRLELRSFDERDTPGTRRQALRPGHLELWF